MFSSTQKIGVLGGGQLGKMLCIAAAPFDFKLYILEKNTDCPAAMVCAEVTAGDFSKYEDVIAFGQDKDVITIEIEHVNTDALKALEEMGKVVHPAPAALEIIKDKGLQKSFFTEKNIPTTAFRLFEDEAALVKAANSGKLSFPFVQKTRTAGYDGKGVAIIRNSADLKNKLLPGACLAEDLVDLAVEIAVIAARNENDEVAVFPAVEMEFHPEANLVEWLICPARISPLVAAQAEALAEKVIRDFNICGLLAVEMFLTNSGDLLVNEVAPRPHNSGHHTIDAAVTSQYEQHLRAICNLPLGDTASTQPSVMINLLGEPGCSGPVVYEGAAEALAIPGVHLHLYGKATTSAFRKMGHVTITDHNIEGAIRKAEKLKQILKVKA